MSAPFLSLLSLAARRAFPIIQLGVRLGTPANVIQRALQDFGLGIRRQTLLDIIRVERGIITASDIIRRRRPEQFIDPALLPEALTKIQRAFSFIVDVVGTDVTTGLRTTRSVTVVSDSVLTRREVEEIASRTITEQFERYQFELESATFARGVRAGPLGHF